GEESDGFSPSITLCENASFAEEEEIRQFLEERYRSYVEVSFRLSILLRQLEALTNTYPQATLHDCEDGDDDNPVRLNRSALGSLSTGRRERPKLVPEPAEPPPEPSSTPRSPSRKRSTRNRGGRHA